ncbi:putative aspergillopepsin-2 protein [Rosellinia necatrix]|uniref:Putative aspergillopepsin-2 protein n=1 Tax=Rosellinia necatrix TaxID=77044 RepID=A0A1W2TU19_ROSNE|nr:putative aspergillopepsin-2 protein [Rosellinia necatrix]
MKFPACFIVLALGRVGRADGLAKRHIGGVDEGEGYPPLLTHFRRQYPNIGGFNISATANWAGATIDIPRTSASAADAPAIGIVKAQWNIPRLCLREGQAVSDAGTLQTWIGIAGRGCEPRGAMMQAGVQAVLRDDGSTAASAWVSWYPAIPHMDILDFDILPGDVITAVLTVSNTTHGIVQMSNRRTNHLVTQAAYSPDTAIGDFSICGNGDGRAWAVVEGALTWERDPPDTATDADHIPVFSDVSFRTLEVSAFGDHEARGLHDDSAVFYIVTDNQSVVVNVDVLGDNGFQLFTSKSCAIDSGNAM